MKRPTIRTTITLTAVLFFLTALWRAYLALPIGIVLLFVLERRLFAPLKNLQNSLESVLNSNSAPELKPDLGHEILDVTSMIQKVLTRLSTLEKQNTRLVHLADHDHLTGLPNRSFSNETMEEIVGDAQVIHFFYVRVVNLRLINDTLGRSAGDALLIETTKRLTRFCSDALYIGCTDGHKFVVIYDDKKLEGMPVFKKGRALIRELEMSVLLEDCHAKLSVGLGISSYPSNTRNLKDLSQNASFAANSTLPNSELNCMIYEDSMLKTVTDRLNMEEAIAKGIEHNEFLPFFQPKLDLFTGKITGAEALIRWFSPTGVVMPGMFIPVASETGLIIPITWLMLEKAGEEYGHFLAEGFDISISVNVPVQAILHTDFVQKTLSIMQKTGMPPHRLDIEITEETLIADISSTSRVIEELQLHGIDVSVDDFGTGYSSLQYLKSMPFNTMKIDKAFVEGVPENKYDKAILKASVELGRALNLKIVVEGVETISQWQTIKEIGCHELQGYVLSKPIYANDFIKLLHEWSSEPTTYSF